MTKMLAALSANEKTISDNSQTLILNNREAINHTLKLAMTNNEKIIVFGEDVGKMGGAFNVTENLQATFGPLRCFDSVMDEATIMGCAIGLSYNGIIPICEIQYQGFMYSALQQLLEHAAKIRNRTRGQYTCPLVLRMPNGISPHSMEHHSQSLEAILAHVPGLKIIMPSNPYDMKGLLLAAINDPDPVVFLEPKRLYEEFKAPVPEAFYEIEIGKAKIVNPGTDLTIVSYGSYLIDTYEAVQQLAKQYPNYQIELIDLRTIKPWDEGLVIASVKKTKKLLVIHEAVESFSVASEIITTVVKHCWNELLVAPKRLCSPDVAIPYEHALPFYVLNQKIIINEILQLLESKE